MGQLPCFQQPQNLLRGVSDPAEVGRIPTKEILAPDRQKVLVLLIACSPPSGDRVTFKINVNATLPRFLQQLSVCDPRVLIGAGRRLISGCRRASTSDSARTS